MSSFRRPAPRGQALVEAALVVPLLLLIILGGAQLGIGMVWNSQLTHVAQQAAVVAAGDGCKAALSAVPGLLGRTPDEAACATPVGPDPSQGQPHTNYYAVTLADRVPLSTPWLPVLRVEVVGRAVSSE